MGCGPQSSGKTGHMSERAGVHSRACAKVWSSTGYLLRPGMNCTSARRPSARQNRRLPSGPGSAVKCVEGVFWFAMQGQDMSCPCAAFATLRGVATVSGVLTVGRFSDRFQTRIVLCQQVTPPAPKSHGQKVTDRGYPGRQFGSGFGWELCCVGTRPRTRANPTVRKSLTVATKANVHRLKPVLLSPRGRGRGLLLRRRWPDGCACRKTSGTQRRWKRRRRPRRASGSARRRFPQ